MTDSQNRLTRFWQELKRRKVIYVITVYASASFVLIELINNVTEPLNLPEGLSTIAIVVLAIGFPFAVVLSWIFDVTPKGVEKTKPVSEAPEKEKIGTPNSWRIATYVSVVVIVGLISFNLITRTSLSENLSQYGKSIAVLPFINDSQDEEDETFINGTMLSILNKLSGINNLRVMQRESVEPYRDTIVPVSEISEKLGVSHVLRGSMRKYGELIVISVQLIDQNNNTVWSGQYESDIHEIEELFNLESKIAQEVASKIKAAITPEELQRIEKVPTTDPTALLLCLKADKDFDQWIQNSPRHPEYLESADQLYRQALTFDSTYAEAIQGLGWIYLENNWWRDRSREDYLDSVMIYSDLALSYNSENANAYLLQGFYYYFLRDWTTAERSYNKSLELNPNYPVAYTFLGDIYKNIRGDFVRAIKYYEEAEKRNRGELITADFYRVLGHACMGTGFFDLAEEYLRKAHVFDGVTYMFTNVMANLEGEKGNLKEAAELEARASSQTDYPGVMFIGLWKLIYIGQIEEANICVRKFEEIEEDIPWWMKPWRLAERGYLSLLNGDKEKAEQFFDQFLYEFNKGAKLGPDWVANGKGHIVAAMIFAYRGQNEQAYKYLDELVEMKNSLTPSEIRHLEINPMFDNIREEERFQKILRKMQSDYMAAHERMRLYLEETGRL